MSDEPTLKTDTETTTETEFSYSGYQVVRGEFFAHLFEPSVTLCDDKISVNTACFRKLPGSDYVQFLVNPGEKKLAVKPCSEDTKDSFCWASASKDGKKRPKAITCRIFFAKIMSLMEWNPNYRYKILGKLIRTPSESIFVFDLTCAEVYNRQKTGSDSTSKSPVFPDEWKNQFGLPVSEHQDHVLVSIFDDYTVFKIDKEEEAKSCETDNDNRSEEEKDQDT